MKIGVGVLTLTMKDSSIRKFTMSIYGPMAEFLDSSKSAGQRIIHVFPGRCDPCITASVNCKSECTTLQRNESLGVQKSEFVGVEGPM
jgi:hypothetical protein